MRPVLPTLLALTLAGCSLVGESPSYSGPDDYAYTLRVACFCVSVGPIRVTVAGGHVSGVEVLDPPEGVGPDVEGAARDLARTLSELSDLARRAEREADDVDVRYDRTYGFPTELHVDWNRGAVDDEVSYRAYDFTPM